MYLVHTRQLGCSTSKLVNKCWYRYFEVHSAKFPFAYRPFFVMANGHTGNVSGGARKVISPQEAESGFRFPGGGQTFLSPPNGPDRLRGSTSPQCNKYRGISPGKQSVLTTYLYLAPKLRISGAIPLPTLLSS
jgi:hypothetical protein